MKQLIPTSDNILIKQNEAVNKTASGLILQGSPDQTKTATVVAVGDKVTTVKVGDEIGVIWSKGYEFKTIEFSGAIIKEEDVLVIVR